MSRIILLKDQAGMWWMGSTDEPYPTIPNPVKLSWPQLFIEKMEDPRQGKVTLGLGSPFASFRCAELQLAWTALMVLPEIENNNLCKMYLQAVQRAKGTGLHVVTDVKPDKPPVG